VKKKADQPFIVDIKNQAKIEVLGTTFNVNAYEDEDNIKATLLEGAVRVTVAGSPGVGGITSKHKSVVLKPGQQAQVIGSGTNNGQTDEIRLVKDANVEQAVAWRNGNFQFDGDEIGEVMRQLTRWYGVEVKYEFRPRVHYTGGISRNLNISSVLHMLSLSGLHCRIDGNTLVVMP
jgi:transmembrane sensor